MQKIARITARHEQMPLKEPFETAKRRASTSDTVFVELTTDHGIKGIGAATPVEYVTRETVESVVSGIERADRALAGRPVRTFATIAGVLSEVLADSPSARAGVEMAVIDAAGKEVGLPAYALFDGTPRTVETDLTIPVVPPEHAARLAYEASLRGFRKFKVKVGSADTDQDLARALAITSAVTGSTLVVDANQGFTPEGAVTFVKRLTRSGVEVELFEQPVDSIDYDGLAFVTRETDVPIYADESAHTPADVARLARRRAVNGINVKLMKSGVFGALAIASLCEKHGLGLMLGCMLEPRVGISAALHVACAAPGFAHFDLDGDLLLADSGKGGFLRSGADLSPLIIPGLGFSDIVGG